MRNKTFCVIAAYFLYRRIMKRKKRRYWVHPKLRHRLLQSDPWSDEFATLRQNKDKFLDYFGMSVETFDELLQCLSPSLKKADTNMRHAISPLEKLAVTLRYLRSGSTFSELHVVFKIGVSTISCIAREVCTAIWSVLVAQAIPVLTEDNWYEVAALFQLDTNFPHCLGAVGGKIVPLTKFCDSSSAMSLVCFAVVDSQYRFLYVDVGTYGKHYDLTMFERSKLYQDLEKNKLNVPKPRLCSVIKTQPVLPFVFVSDKGFGFSTAILRPYGGRCYKKEQQIFNYRLSRAEKCIECAFAILSNKWHVFNKPFSVSLELAVDVTKACTVLHNFVIKREGHHFEDTLTVDGFEDIPRHFGNGPRNLNCAKETLTRYFMEEGAIPWQDRVV